ncbi:MAG TPA: LCP family protein [Candidatus Limnocylindrales bacterium]|nr:LCP family protein [Candidatus Limnocylindrales bacterium]
MAGSVTPGASARLLLYAALVPGLGHIRLGRRLQGAVFALPLVVGVGAVAGIAFLLGPTSLAARLIDPAVLAGLIVVQLGLLVWRAGAVASTAAAARPPLTGATVLWTLVALAALVVPQAYAAYLTMVAREAALEIFAPASGGAWVPAASSPPVAPDDGTFATAPPSPSATASAAPSPSPTVERVNVLLIGMDSGVGRQTALTDTLIVASLDPLGETVSLLSIPRDLVDVPLPDGRVFRPKINSLVSYVRWHPADFPDAPTGQAVLAAALGELLGLRIDHWAQVDMSGFIGLVDSVGGIDLTVRDGFCDPTYDEYGMRGFSITPGRYHFDGARALAYARIRKAAGESDFTRAARQQEVLGAIRDRIVAGGMLRDPAGFLRSLARTVKTNVSPALVAEYVDIATRIERGSVYRAVLREPLVRTGFDARGSIQMPDPEGIRELAAGLFPAAGSVPDGFETMPAETDGATKPAPRSSSCRLAPRPSPTPTLSASPSASPDVSPSSPSGSLDPGASPGATDAPIPTDPATPAPTPTTEPTPSPSPPGTSSPPPAIGG